jgi:excisionase family DNA binding protein
MKNRQIMTCREVADYLRFTEDTVSLLASEKKLPGVKIGKCWRFKRTSIESLFTNEQFDVIAGLNENAYKS